MAEILDWNLLRVSTCAHTCHKGISTTVGGHINACTSTSPAVWARPGCWKGLSEHLLKGKLLHGRGTLSVPGCVSAAGPSLLSPPCQTLLSHSKPDQNAVCSELYFHPRGRFKKVRFYLTVYISLPGRGCVCFAVFVSSYLSCGFLLKLNTISEEYCHRQALLNCILSLWSVKAI